MFDSGKSGSGVSLNLFVGPHQHKRKKPTFLHIKHDLPYSFANKCFFRPRILSKILSRRSGYYFIDIFSIETLMVVSMSEKSSTPKGMKC